MSSHGSEQVDSRGAGVQAGDIVAVEMERDEELRTVEPPLLLKRELAKSQAAQANWEKQSFSNRKEMARSIEQVKREEPERADWRRSWTF